MSKSDTYGVCLFVSSSDLTLDTISKATGLKPDEYQEKGKPKQFLANKSYLKNVWIYDSRYHIDEKASIDAHLDHISTVIDELTPNAKSFLKNVDIVIGLRGYVYSCNPGCSITKKVLKSIMQLDAEIDIDFFAVGPEG